MYFFATFFTFFKGKCCYSGVDLSIFSLWASYTVDTLGWWPWECI